MNGGVGLTGQSPRAAWMSVWHRPLASMRTRTCPSAGSGVGMSLISNGWSKLVTTAARMEYSFCRVLRSASMPAPVGGQGRWSTAARDLRHDHLPRGGSVLHHEAVGLQYVGPPRPARRAQR